MSKKWFNERKAAQVVAYFATKAGDKIDIIKAVKLVYLADRRNMKKYGYPILHDYFVSMPYGPVNSNTLNYINGAFEDQAQWDEFVTSRSGNTVSAAKAFEVDDFDELSDAELESLRKTWKKFGLLEKWTLVRWTHDNCPEWEDPKGSAQEIPYERVYKFLKRDDHEALAQQVEDDRRVERVFSRLRA